MVKFHWGFCVLFVAAIVSTEKLTNTLLKSYPTTSPTTEKIGLSLLLLSEQSDAVRVASSDIFNPVVAGSLSVAVPLSAE